MPTYDYKCPECSLIEEQIHSMKENPIFICPHCNGKKIEMIRQISFNNTGFVIKGGSISKDWKEERYRIKRSADLGVKQLERYGEGSSRLKPNVAGVEVESWSDASKMAKEAGLNSASYTPLIEKEKRTSKTSGIDDLKYKKAKEAKDKL